MLSKYNFKEGFVKDMITIKRLAGQIVELHDRNLLDEQDMGVMVRLCSGVVQAYTVPANPEPDGPEDEAKQAEDDKKPEKKGKKK